MESSLQGRRSAAVILLVAGVALTACTERAERTARSALAQDAADRGYGALAALPDWSGTWASDSGSGPEANVAFRDCCLGDGSQVPFTPKYAQMRREFGSAENNRPLRNELNRNNSASCIPAGMPAVLAHPILFEFLYTPGRVTMIFNDGEIRRIHTDRDQHPPAEELDIGFSGYSIGQWEGKTLHVDTRHIDPRADVFMANNIKVTANTQVNESITLGDDGRLRIDFTVTDAEIFTRPYKYTLYYVRVPGDFEPGCAANNFDDGQELNVPEL